jgi:hypothetical protein
VIALALLPAHPARSIDDPRPAHAIGSSATVAAAADNTNTNLPQEAKRNDNRRCP